MIGIGEKIESFALPKGHTGVIVKQYDDRKGANGENLYDVIDENGEVHTIVESLFDNVDTKKEGAMATPKKTGKRPNIEMMKIEIEQSIDEVVRELGLCESDDAIEQLRNCCLVQKYIIEHNNYDNNIMAEKETYSDEEIAIIDLYNAVVLHNGVCSSNSLMFKKILERVGQKVEVVGLISNQSGAMHASNLALLDGKYYFFDSTLDSRIYEENKQESNGELLLCCAGLGKEDYCKYYTPQVILPESALDNILPLPDNISEGRIPFDLVNNLISSATGYSN